ncbi:sodium:solute symporter family transporter [Vallitalea sp.]|jgi:sodium/proline symporter|uniref:sodium:solute symporter family transporter n=1 Tax=Vallitalea sp. TaxID=1882829 RepID=UPI0025DE4DCC|nr:sodium:solute symporter [Vallitalea sp.]MCT4688560.1 sodium:solute symporter [Vallitalea sp.]
MKVYWFFLVGYILMIMVVSAMSRKKVEGVSGYLLGGRRVPPWMSAFSYGTAYFSAVLFIGYAGKLGWNFGLSVLWIVVGNTVIGTYLAWEVLGKRTREMTQRLNVSTMPEFLGVRYKSKPLKIVSATIIFVFLMPYAASVYKGLGYLFEEIFGIPTYIILIIMMVLTALYLFAGGLVAATMVDFIQGCIMIVGVILMLFFVIKFPTVGGLSGAISNLKSINKELISPIGPPGVVPILSLVILTSLGSWGLPQMVHKFYTIKSEKSIKTAKWVSTAFALLITTGAYFTGSISRLIISECPTINGMPVYDRIMPLVISETLPTVVAAIILVLVLSASMSTLASLVLASSSAITIDLLKTVKPDINGKTLMWVMKVLCVVFVALSYIVATSDSPILNLASLSWGAVSGCLLAPYLLGLYWEKATKQGVWVGMLTAISIVIYGVSKYGFGSSNIPTVGALAIVVPIITMSIVSLVTESYEERHINYIFAKEVK